MRLSLKKPSQTGLALWHLVAGLALLLVLTISAIIYWSPERVARRQQSALLQAIEKRSPSKISRLISPSYSDRWDFSREDAVNAMLDAGSQFLVLVVKGEEVMLEKNEKGQVEITMHLNLSGSPMGPAAGEVIRRINSLKKPFHFVWEKSGFLPNSWRLTQIENEDIPDEIYGYNPGDIRRIMQGGD